MPQLDRRQSHQLSRRLHRDRWLGQQLDHLQWLDHVPQLDLWPGHRLDHRQQIGQHRPSIHARSSGSTASEATCSTTCRSATASQQLDLQQCGYRQGHQLDRVPQLDR